MTHSIVRFLTLQTDVFIWYAWWKVDSIKCLFKRMDRLDGWFNGEINHSELISRLLLNYIRPFSYFQLPSGQLTPNSYWTFFQPPTYSPTYLTQKNLGVIFYFSFSLPPTYNQLSNFSHIHPSTQIPPLLSYRPKSSLNSTTARKRISWFFPLLSPSSSNLPFILLQD